LVQSSENSPFSIKNVRLFIAFRVFFNARFYYPVFTILFLDFGLTLQQFALLNAVWAATIVVVEVPSGAMADIVGRRKLLVTAGVLMVIEMALLCFVPLGRPTLLFTVFLINRVFSGTAEASASGADEAIAYDTLKREGNAQDWGRVLESQMRLQSIAFIGASIIGAAAYDPALMQRLADLIGLRISLTQEVTLRFPIYLTLAMAVLTLLTTLRLDEKINADEECFDLKNCGKSIAEALRLTMQAGAWILKTPFALIIISAGLLFDHIIRMLLTLNSQYYRLIQLPEASFGLIGSGMALLGVFIPHIAFKLAQRHSPRFNLAFVSILTVLGLWGMTLFLPIIGLVPALLLGSVMFLMNFFVSHYLNRITSSRQRATVLSFKGLSNNLAYGAIGLLYALLIAFLRSQVATPRPTLGKEALENEIFIESIGWFPWYFVLTVAALLVFAHMQLRDSGEHKTPG
jgi:MFS family permease